jgi:hypothetical protein
MKAVLTKAHKNFQAGDQLDVTPAEFAVLVEADSAVTLSEWQAQENIRAAETEKQRQVEAGIDAAIVQARRDGRLLPKEDSAAVKASALAMEKTLPGAGKQYIQGLPVKVDAKSELLDRVTTSADPESLRASGVEAGEQGLRETIKAYYAADKPWQDQRRNGGLVRHANNDPHKLHEIQQLSMIRSRAAQRVADLIVKGADMSQDQVANLVKAGDYVDPASNNPLGVLNTGLLLQWNLGFLANQLALLGDITTDISGQPVLFNQMVRTRYITIPKVMLKSTTNAWPNTGAPTGTDVDVNVTMDVHAGVPISINNNILSATPRQLFNEQRQPQLYSLGEYIIYKLIYNAFNGNTRYANDGSSTSTIVFDPGYTNAGGTDTFNVAGATLATFTADLPEAMDESTFPGGDEDPGDPNLQRFAWVHGRVYAGIAADTNYLLNQSIWGAVAKTGENTVETGRYNRVGNIRIRKSQLVTDQCTATGSGADSTTNGIVVSAGTYTSATKVGIAATRSALIFVSRVPLDYTKVLPDVPSTAAIELVSEPRTGLTLMVVKFLDHAYETANLRAQLMFGTAIGDERQGMYLVRQ